MNGWKSKVASRPKHDQPLPAFCKTCQLKRKEEEDSEVLCETCSALQDGDENDEISKALAPYVERIDQKAAERVQLLNTFLSEHYPSNVEPEVYLARHMSLFMNLPGVDISSPMMSSAVDTLCLAHLGSNRHDQRLVYASQNAYGRVLASIMGAVSGKSKHRYTPREVIAACLLMSVYNDGSPGESRAKNYATHLFGASQFAQACGPGCLDPKKGFDQKILMWVRFQSLFVSAAKRRKFFWDSKGWRAKEDSFPPGGSRDWFPLLVPLPGLLEVADGFLFRLVKTEGKLGQVERLCKQLDEYRERLLNWVEHDFAGRPSFAAITDPDNFDFEIEEHCFLTSSNTFTTFHVFTNPAHAMRCIDSWFLCLVADCTLLRLLRTYPSLQQSPTLALKFEQIEHKAFLSAIDICKSVYYYSVLNSLAYAHMLVVFLDLAQTFFEEYGAVREVGWCQACLIATKLRLEKPRSKKRGTLCRIGDLMGCFSKACRYRTGWIATGEETEEVVGRFDSPMGTTATPSGVVEEDGAAAGSGDGGGGGRCPFGGV